MATQSDPTAKLETLKLLKIAPLDDVRWVERIRILDKQCFPVNYTEKYYANLFPEKPHHLSQTAFWGDILVGSCTVRLEPLEEGSDKFKAYVMTLGTLEAYRGHGIATRLLQAAIVQAQKNVNIEQICLHVQVGSKAFDFYTKRFDFKVEKEVPGYYTDIEPTDALFLTKPIVHAVKDKKKGKK